MFPAPRSPAPESDEWRRGWPIVIAAMIGIGTGPGLYQNLSSLFIPGLQRSFGWSRGDIATAAGIGLLGAFAAPFIGRAIDRFGVRPAIIVSMFALAAAFLCLASLSGPLWQYQAVVLVLAITAPGCSALVYGKLIARIFTRHRGLALGVATSGVSITTLLAPAPIAALIADHGWRAGGIALAVVAAIGLSLILIAIRGQAGHDLTAERAASAASPGVGAGRARRSSAFWRLAASIVLVNMASVGLVTQLVPLGIDRGLSGAQAALLLTSYGAAQIVGRLVMGALIDRFPPQAMAAIAALISAAGFALLADGAPGFSIALVAVFLAGLMNGAEHDLLPFFTLRLFGLKAYGEIYGTLFTLALLGIAAGVIGFGRLHDTTGSYTLALMLATGALVLAALSLGSLAHGPPFDPEPA